MSEGEFEAFWKSCFFVIDTNVLLNLYRYSSAPRKTFIDLLKHIADRLWIPHQVAFEYHNNRIKVIVDQKKAYQELQERLNEVFNKIENHFKVYSKHPLIESGSIIQTLKKGFDEIVSELQEQEKRHPNLLERDDLLEEITNIFEGKVGDSYPPEELTKIFSEGEIRYKAKTPPGFEDTPKDGSAKYGDLIMWFQIIKFAKEKSKNIIFITDERKRDWWKTIESGKTFGPLPELRQEFYNKTGMTFYMYQADKFVEYADKYLQQKAKPEDIEEIRKIGQHEEEVQFQYGTFTLPVFQGVNDYPIGTGPMVRFRSSGYPDFPLKAGYSGYPLSPSVIDIYKNTDLQGFSGFSGYASYPPFFDKISEIVQAFKKRHPDVKEEQIFEEILKVLKE